MMTLLSFMEKIYSDTKTLSMIYIIGSILLFIFIILLIFSLRKPANKTKIIDEPNIDSNESKEEVNEESNVTEDSKEEIKEEPVKETEKQEEKKNLEDILNVTEPKEEPIVEEEKSEPEKKEKPKEEINKISSEIPSIDDYVDNIVNKTYEKNEQFSSVYVNTGTIKLEKVLDKLNVDDDIKEEIVPEDEKVEKKEVLDEPKEENKLDNLKSALEQKQKENNNNLDKLESLKKSLEEKRNSVTDKQDDLKNKLAALKNNNSNKLDDLKNKLDNLKNQQ